MPFHYPDMSETGHEDAFPLAGERRLCDRKADLARAGRSERDAPTTAIHRVALKVPKTPLPGHAPAGGKTKPVLN
jgi:hypothetical protein